MNTTESQIITIVLSDIKNAGTVAKLLKDFNIYQKSQQSILLNVLVPKSLIGGEIKKQYFDINGQMITESGVYTALKTGMSRVDKEGNETKTDSYYLRFIKEIREKGKEYYFYQRELPNAFSFFSGTGLNAPELVFNLVNILNNISVDESGETIVNKPAIINTFTSQKCKIDVLPSTELDKDPSTQPTEWDLLQGQVDKIIQTIMNIPSADKTILKYNLLEELPQGVSYNADGFKSPGVLFYNAEFDIPNLDYSTDRNAGAVIVTNTTQQNGKTKQIESFFYDNGFSQRVIELNDKLEPLDIGEWSVKVDRKQSKEHIGEFLYVDKNGNINFTKALKDLITKSDGEELTSDTSAYDFSSMFKLTAKNKEEVKIDGSDELKAVLKNAEYDLETGQLKLARFNGENFTLQLPTKLSQFENDTEFITKEVDNLTNYTKSEGVGNKLTFSVDPETYILTVNLLNSNDEVISSGNVDLPLESMIIDGRYENGYVYLMLKSGTEINFSIASLISGLVPSTRKVNGQTLDKDIVIPIPTKLSELEEDAEHRTVTDEEKVLWNNRDYNSLDNLPIIPEGVEVIDNLESTRKDASASANMARELNENKVDKTEFAEIYDSETRTIKSENIELNSGKMHYDPDTDTFIFDGNIDTGENNPIVQQLNELKAQVQVLQTRVNNVYPIGSIYISVSATNPSNLFGGTWQQLEDRFLLGAGQLYSAGAIGGSADAIVVEHSHLMDIGFDLSASSELGYGASLTHAGTTSKSILSSGESGIGKNMPPYLVVYIWKRIS